MLMIIFFHLIFIFIFNINLSFIIFIFLLSFFITLHSLLSISNAYYSIIAII